MIDLRSLVYAALDVAIKENGYTELLTNSPFTVADDLTDYDASLENELPEDLEPFVIEYQKGVPL